MNVRLIGSLLLLSLGVAQANAQNETAAKAKVHARVTGYIEKVHVKPGATVRRGDVLYEIEPAVYRAELAQVSAEMAAAEAMLQRHSADFERAKRLLENKVIAREDFDKLAAERTVAQANLSAVRARLDLAKLRLDATKVVAPMDGTIVRPLQDVGSLVKAEETLLCEIVQGPIKTPANIRALQKERNALLAEVATQAAALFKLGTVPLTEVLQAQCAALAAELEICDTAAERVELLRIDISLAESAVKITEARNQAGRANPMEMLRARAALLEARIRLLREEGKTAGQEKR
jgi:multidrug efflux pump subunit AcrA (membrane-fusion protein)